MNKLRKPNQRMKVTFSVIILFFIFGLTNSCLLVFCFGNNGHSAIELTPNADCCKSHSNFMENHSSFNFKSTANIPTESNCGSCLDIPVLNYGRLSSNNSSPIIQHILQSSSFAEPPLITNFLKENIVRFLSKTINPAGAARPLLATIILLI